MSKKAKQCDECQHFAHYDGPLCAKGHTPRFYLPTRVMAQGWGHKRRCEDFKEIEGAPTTERREQ